MSFSAVVKDELSRLCPPARHCQLAEIAAILSSIVCVEHNSGNFEGAVSRLQWNLSIPAALNFRNWGSVSRPNEPHRPIPPKERIARLIEQVNENTRRKSEKYVGKTIEILCEDYDAKKGLYLGRSEAGRMGYFASEQNVIGEFVDLKVERANGISLFGILD